MYVYIYIEREQPTLKVCLFLLVNPFADLVAAVTSHKRRRIMAANALQAQVNAVHADSQKQGSGIALPRLTAVTTCEASMTSLISIASSPLLSPTLVTVAPAPPLYFLLRHKRQSHPSRHTSGELVLFFAGKKLNSTHFLYQNL